MDYKEIQGGVPEDVSNDKNINEKSTSEMFAKIHFLIESLETSKKIPKTLREILESMKLLKDANLSEFVLNSDQFFVKLLFSYVSDIRTAISALEIIFVLLKNSEECVKVLYDNDIISLLLQQLEQKSSTDINCLVCKCLGKCLKAFQNYGFNFKPSENFIFSLFSYASSVYEGFQKDYSKVIYLLLKYYDCSEFIDYFIAQAMIILEHRKSNESIKYVILQVKEILAAYPDKVSDFMDYNLIDTILESKIVDTNFDSIAILNTIQAFIEINNEEITQKIKDKLQVEEIHNALKSNNEATVYNALLLFQTCLEHNIILLERIDAGNIIDTIVQLLDTGLIETKVKAIYILLLDQIVSQLTIPQKIHLVETGVDIIQDLKDITCTFILALYSFVVHGGDDSQKFIDLYQELDIKEILESYDFDDEATQHAIEQFCQLFEQ